MATKKQPPRIKEREYTISHIIGLKELREHTEKYIRAVEEGTSFTVVRRSKPIFKMVPVDGIDEWSNKFIKKYKKALDGLKDK